MIIVIVISFLTLTISRFFLITKVFKLCLTTLHYKIVLFKNFLFVVINYKLYNKFDLNELCKHRSGLIFFIVFNIIRRSTKSFVFYICNQLLQLSIKLLIEISENIKTFQFEYTNYYTICNNIQLSKL